MRYIFFIFTLTFGAVFSQEYSYRPVPDSLLGKANAVVQFDRTDIDLINSSKMLIKRRVAITVLNEKGDWLAELSLGYNKENKIQKVFMAFYDKNGKLIKKVNKKDFDDYAYSDNHTLYSDDRFIHYQLPAMEYPYTVYYEYERIDAYTAFIPSWDPVPGYNIAILESAYIFTYPAGKFSIQTSELNTGNFPISIKKGPGKIIARATYIPPLQYEPFAPGFYHRTPHLKIAVTPFYLAGVYGEGGQWDKFGKWMYNKLLKPRDNLSEKTKEEIRALVKDAPTQTEKAKRVYEFMQNKTRYVNIAIGIGGWQPMFTGDVDRLGYGDCKALTFYTKALMEAAEIPSYYTLVYAGHEKRDIDKNVVGVQGNHAILCLPLEKDTVWLECTNPKLPFGHKSTFTEDRDVLVIKNDGAEIRHTPISLPEENLLKVQCNYNLDSSGHISGKAEMKAYGSQYENFLSSFDGISPSERIEKLKNFFSLNNLNFTQITALNNKNATRYELAFYFQLDDYPVWISDTSFLLMPNIFNKNTYVPPREDERTTPFILYGYMDRDIYTIEIPENFSLSGLPGPVKLETPFGYYRLEIKKTDDRHLRYEREMLIKRGTYKAEDYNKYRKFRKKIKKYETTSILFSS